MTLVFNLTASWLEQKERTQPQRGFFNPGNISYFSSKYRFVDLPHSYDLFFPTEKQTQAENIPDPFTANHGRLASLQTSRLSSPAFSRAKDHARLLLLLPLFSAQAVVSGHSFGSPPLQLAHLATPASTPPASAAALGHTAATAPEPHGEMAATLGLPRTISAA